MNGTLDRALEDALCALIRDQLPSGMSAVQVVSYLRGGGEINATVPRVVIQAQSQDTPELYKALVSEISVTAQSISVATDKTSSAQEAAMNTAIDAIFTDSCIAANLTNSAMKVYGFIYGGETQEMQENRLIRTRSAVAHAKLR